ncbi:MAG TPA: RagB/SusD family nutrient uptake outer membrane protein [Chitinophagaceae bacterium]|nr:RagB/SusD family nutrient uptake outer membrane protein [Chitinophagaceae bacterium]
MNKLITMIIATVLLLASCKKYLDEKSDKSLVVPATLQDVQALLDNYSTMNATYPYIGSQGDDDFYVTDTYFNTLSVTNQDNYIWSKDAENKNEWTYMYRAVMAANLALETLDKITPTSATISDWNRLKGSALFFRAYAFYQLAQYYALPYNKATAAQKLGIPLRLSTDVNELSVRSSLENTWQQIVSDLRMAVQLLPAQNTEVYHPSKAAAFGALARTYLAMEDYVQAGNYADSCLQLNSSLMDYNSLNAAASNPFTRWNTEVIFSSVCLGASMLSVNNWKCDSLLYQSYDQNDLRKTCFFKANSGGVYGFKGNYDGTTSSSFFNGIATDEMYLIKAECQARNNNVTEAMNALNDLLTTRWRATTFVRLTASDADQALRIILTERRKELVLRSTRWFDLRRLNKDVRFAKTLTRKISGQLYTLPPDDNRYTHYIPFNVIAITGMQQNER